MSLVGRVLGSVPVVAAGLVVALVGASATVVARAADDPPQRRAAAPPGPAPVPSASPSPTALPPEDLDGRLLVPGGDHTAVPDAEADAGDLTVQELVALEGNTVAATEEDLRGLGFRAARAHAYTSGDAVVLVLVTRFASPRSARALLDANRDADRGRTFRSGTVPGAFTTEEDLGGAVRQSGHFTRGPYFYFLGRTTATRPPDTRAFDVLLKEQRDLAERSDP